MLNKRLQENLSRQAPYHVKFEIRISKSETNLKPNESQTRKIQNSESDRSSLEHCSCCIFHRFEFVSNFGFRASNFFLGVLCALCARHPFSDFVSQYSTKILAR